VVFRIDYVEVLELQVGDVAMLEYCDGHQRVGALRSLSQPTAHVLRYLDTVEIRVYLVRGQRRCHYSDVFVDVFVKVMNNGRCDLEP